MGTHPSDELIARPTADSTDVRRLAGDTSLQTFTGHQVLRTLIRAKFSPAATTGQQYIYSGSADGNVYGPWGQRSRVGRRD